MWISDILLLTRRQNTWDKNVNHSGKKREWSSHSSNWDVSVSVSRLGRTVISPSISCLPPLPRLFRVTVFFSLHIARCYPVGLVTETLKVYSRNGCDRFQSLFKGRMWSVSKFIQETALIGFKVYSRNGSDRFQSLFKERMWSVWKFIQGAALIGFKVYSRKECDRFQSLFKKRLWSVSKFIQETALIGWFLTAVSCPFRRHQTDTR